jgi:ubiquinone/menaquinone biosynthesis C-methylase UbiE
VLGIHGTQRPDGLWDCLPEGLRSEKQVVQQFYDATGWRAGDDGTYADTALFVDRRPHVDRYMARCRARVLAQLPPGGRYLLDVASGPVHFAEYQAYSAQFDQRVCVDLSERALHGARRNIGEAGVYVLGDVTNLPIAEGAVDAAVSLHTLYHVPRDEQAAAFREIHRVLKPGGVAVVVYYWQTTPWRELGALERAAALPSRLLRRLVRRGSSDAAGDLYYFAHTRHWFERQAWPFEAEILAWSSVDTDTLRRFARGPAAAPMTRALFWLESRFPRALGRYGYPMIVIRKAPAAQPAG